MSLIGIVATSAMAVGLLMIPLGWPGAWVMVGIVGVGALLGHVGWGVLVLATLVAGAAELIEFLLVQQAASRHGTHTRSAWGAVIGGTAGVALGYALPPVGPVLGGVAGSFLGAAAATLLTGGRLDGAGRAAWPAVVVPIFVMGVKVGAAIMVLILGGTAWILA
jgi:uncharacterized protein